ncbi:MAG: hypothetical protein R6X05_00145 [Desulfobacterales bacterium]|jgi:hypothetical protein
MDDDVSSHLFFARMPFNLGRLRAAIDKTWRQTTKFDRLELTAADHYFYAIRELNPIKKG